VFAVGCLPIQALHECLHVGAIDVGDRLVANHGFDVGLETGRVAANPRQSARVARLLPALEYSVTVSPALPFAAVPSLGSCFLPRATSVKNFPFSRAIYSERPAGRW
jgi:hypothetical protein